MQNWIENEFFKEAYSTWEEETFDTIDPFANNNTTFLDIGCWVGPLSIPYSQNFKHVVSLDADKESLKCVKSIIETNSIDNITVIHKALSNKRDEFVIFGPNKQWGEKGVLNTSTSQIKSEETNLFDYKIETIVLDDLINECKKHSENVLIKIDIEGGEFRV